MPKHLKYLQEYEVEFLLEEMNITKDVFDRYKKQYIKEFGKSNKDRNDKIRFYGNH